MKKWYKLCPYCANEIRSWAIKCQHCHEDLQKSFEEDTAKEIKKVKKTENEDENSINKIKESPWDSLADDEKSYLQSKTTWEKILFFFFTWIWFLYSKRWLEFFLVLWWSFLLVYLLWENWSWAWFIISRLVLLMPYTEKLYNNWNTRLNKLIKEYREKNW